MTGNGAGHGYEAGRLDLPFVGIATFAKRPYVADWDAIEYVRESVDLWYYDYKVTDPDDHPPPSSSAGQEHVQFP